MEFSWRLRYRVLDETLCGTSFKPFLVQITRLAWLEQLQGAGQAGLASANLGPSRCGHNKSWTNQMRGEGLKKPVTIAACMATESCPAPFLKQKKANSECQKPSELLKWKCNFNNDIHKTRERINFFYDKLVESGILWHQSVIHAVVNSTGCCYGSLLLRIITVSTGLAYWRKIYRRGNERERGQERSKTAYMYSLSYFI